MNYLRGAVNAISAPYHYYKDLPPINPSTLTGAIDVIVVQRPTDDGDTELICSPFHVRFGKWQVLRPGEKKVNVSINGHPIPFNMKIGEAGEAFFVFETDGDVPEDLITSPILQPTRLDEVLPNVDIGETQDPAQQQSDNLMEMMDEERLIKEESESQEPEFLDLNAPPSPPPEDVLKNTNATPKQTFEYPVFAQGPSLVTPGSSTQFLPSPPSTPTRSFEMREQDLRVDEALKSAKINLHVPEVEYHNGIALDAEGYHFHDPERSDQTVTHYEDHSPPLGSTSRLASPSSYHVVEPSDESNTQISIQSFPLLRAASEPPPDVEDHSQRLMTSSQQETSPSKLTQPIPLQEYSWEWGAFPQPSPFKGSFGKEGRLEAGIGRTWSKGKGKEKASMNLSGLTSVELNKDGVGVEYEYERSQSVPPELEGSPAIDWKGKPLTNGDGYREPEGGRRGTEATWSEDRSPTEQAALGKGGKLRPSKIDPKRFVLQTEERKVVFELSIVSQAEKNGDISSSLPEPGKGVTGEIRHRSRHGVQVFDGGNGVETARIFSQGKLDFRRFLDDDEVVNSPGLVIRWADHRYTTRNDGSPFIDELVILREAALRERDSRIQSRPTSPLSDEETFTRPPLPPSLSEELPQDGHHHRSMSEPPEKLLGKPISTSWVPWWKSSGKTERSAEKEDTSSMTHYPEKVGQQGLQKTHTPPLENESTVVLPEAQANEFEINQESSRIPPAASAPAYPSTPVQRPVPDSTQVQPGVTEARKKYAKTLRLTSAQLKTLNLKPGANVITFSLSTSGVVACTARIFVWDSTDLVVVSDIDGTITKSDGLGHVFAMIGRDWTHLGVAKLYTDITRNGYKIMYLTSRAIGQADATRDYLKGIKQNNYQLPEGPVIMSPDRLMASLHREVIMRKPEVFKMACLRDIQRLFGEASRNPFYAGFGNRITDALSYRSVNVLSERIFTIDSSGEVKMELLRLAGYKSSYIHMTDLVDQMFPPIHRKWMPEYTDFNYWKQPLQEYPLPDLSPPSPALSARSDTSGTLARLRNFSLRPGSSRASSPPTNRSTERRSSRLREMSSFERLSSTLGLSQAKEARSVSPGSYSSTSYDSDNEEDDLDGDGEIDGRRGRKERRRSMASMPGTLDEGPFEDDEPYFGGVDRGDDEKETDVIESGEEAFDEDLLAAGEMKNVPFL